MADRPRVFVSRRIPDDGLEPILAGADATVWPDELPPPRDALLHAIEGMDGVLTLLTDRVDAEFLAFSQAAGNDLSTPMPAFGFPGLKPGDCWCLCAARWKEALDAGKAPKVRLAATHEVTLEIVPLELLKKYALDLS